jgi:hypothetical protein
VEATLEAARWVAAKHADFPDGWTKSMGWMSPGYAFVLVGRYAEAAPLLERGERGFASIGDGFYQAMTLVQLAVASAWPRPARRGPGGRRGGRGAPRRDAGPRRGARRLRRARRPQRDARPPPRSARRALPWPSRRRSGPRPSGAARAAQSGPSALAPRGRRPGARRRRRP